MKPNMLLFSEIYITQSQIFLVENQRIYGYSTGENVYYLVVNYCIDRELFMTNDVVVFHFVQAYRFTIVHRGLTYILSLNFCRLFVTNETD